MKMGQFKLVIAIFPRWIGELFRPGYPGIMNSEEIKSVDWLGSACLLLRRTALDQVGLLDESYFIYGDEADLQFRMKKAGWDIYYLPDATTIHFGGKSMTRWPRRKMVYRGKLLFYKKNYGQIRTIMLRSMLLVLSIIKLVIWSVIYIIPSQRELSKNELNSNLDVVKLCFNLT